MPKTCYLTLLMGILLLAGGCLDPTGDDDDISGDDDIGDDDSMDDDDTGDDDSSGDDDDSGDDDSGDDDSGDDDAEPVTCSSLAADIDVPADYAQIQDAIYAASQGHEICVDAGTYPEHINFIGMDVRVFAAAGPSQTVIDGMGTGSAVTFQQGESPAAILEGFMVTNGRAQNGGGIYVHQASPTLTDLVVSANEADHKGGGIYLENSQSALTRLVVEGNYADHIGGGISLISASPDLTYLQIVDNSSSHSGAGLAVEWSSAATASHLTLLRNVSGHEGGGIDMYSSTLDFSNGVIADNWCSHKGGGITIGFNSYAALTNIAVTGNVADHEGGGVNVYESDALLTNVTIAGNSATNDGGGIMLFTASPTLINVSLTENHAPAGGGIYNYWGPYPSQDPSLDHCNVWGNTGYDFDGMASPIGADGNVSLDPQYLDTSDPSSENWDLHLSNSAPLIDMGDPAIVDPDGTCSDMGAYGGPGADQFDLDWDGYPEWWLPGAYDPATSPGMDCDDGDGNVYPGNGC